MTDQARPVDEAELDRLEAQHDAYTPLGWLTTLRLIAALRTAWKERDEAQRRALDIAANYAETIAPEWVAVCDGIRAKLASAEAVVEAARKIEPVLLSDRGADPLLHGDEKHRMWLVARITQLCMPLRQAIAAYAATVSHD